MGSILMWRLSSWIESYRGLGKTAGISGLLALLIMADAPAAMPRSSSGTLVPRTILALYDSHNEPKINESRIHRMAEMPLNHLGLTVEYHDVRKPLPSVDRLDHLRGVLTWLYFDGAMEDPEAFLLWAETLIDRGNRFVVLGELGAERDRGGRVVPRDKINRFLSKLGLRDERSRALVTYDSRIIQKTPEIVEFERSLDGVLPPYHQFSKIDSRFRSHLVLRRGSDLESDSHIVVEGPTGGYVVGDYTHHVIEETDFWQWRINPFEFFRLAFATDEVPKPDTTTLSGRRIYYSHIDGDGWRNLCQIPRYKRRYSAAAEVIFAEILKSYPDLPVTVAPIAADLDPQWYGSLKSLQLARRIFSLPHVEAGTHTYTHPLDWGFFRDYDRGKEGRYDASLRHSEVEYSQPRAYSLRPFDLTHDIQGSIDFITRLLPPGKRVEVVQWSGNCEPFEAALRAAKISGTRNINGGDTRFDEEFASYIWVSPVGLKVGPYWQVYASTSNENTYTELWTERFFGFQHLNATLRNVEAPIRLKPFNVYYHMYSGERLPSLSAVKANLDFARTQELTPVTASHFAGIANGFFSARIWKTGENMWKIENRDHLQTVRFDEPDLAVDFDRSSGVIGQRRQQGSLYVALDAVSRSPIIALTRSSLPVAPYLVHSRWRIWDVDSRSATVRFSSQGFGAGSMQWQVHATGLFIIEAFQGGKSLVRQEVMAQPDGLLEFHLEVSAIQPIFIEINKIASASDSE